MISLIFSTRLRETRKANKLTLQELGKNVGMKKNTLSGIENCKEHISFDAAIRIAEYFCLSIDYLVGRNDDPQYEYYLQKFENALLLDMPEPFIKIFNYAKTKGFKNEPLTYEEHFKIIRMFQEWKNLCIAPTEQFGKESAHRDTIVKAKLQKLEHNLGKLIDFSLYAASESEKYVLSDIPNDLIDYLYQITEDEMKHTDR